MGPGPLALALAVLVLAALALFKSHTTFGRPGTPAAPTTVVGKHGDGAAASPSLSNAAAIFVEPTMAAPHRHPVVVFASDMSRNTSTGATLHNDSIRIPALRRRHRRSAAQHGLNHSAAFGHKGQRGRAGLYRADFRWPRQSQSTPIPAVRSRLLAANRQERWLQPTRGPPHLSFQTLKLHRNLSKFSYLWHTTALPKADRIPSILHQIWLGDPTRMPWHILNDVRAMLGNWTVVFWTEQNLSWVPYNKLYQRFRKRFPIQKASDLARYAILYRFGGWYVDADIQLLRRLEPLNSALVEGADCLTVHEGNKQAPLYLANGILGCRPHSAAMKFVLQSLPFRDFQQNDHKCTGPRLIADVHFRDETQPVFTLLPANTFICGNWACPRPTCKEGLTRYGWHMHLRFIVWEGKEVSSKEQPLHPPCEARSATVRPFSLAAELPNPPPSPRYANALGLSSFCASLHRPAVDQDASTYLVQVVEAQHQVVVMDTDGHCLGSARLPVHDAPETVVAATFTPHNMVVFLTQSNRSISLLVWDMIAEVMTRLPLALKGTTMWGLHCDKGTCLVSGCAACGRSHNAARSCFVLQQVALEDGQVQLDHRVDVPNLHRGFSCEGGELLVTQSGRSAYAVLPRAGLILQVDLNPARMGWMLQAPAVLPSATSSAGFHVQSILAATLVPSTSSPDAPSQPEAPTLLVAFTLQPPNSNTVLLRIEPKAMAGAVATLVASGMGMGTVLSIRLLWSGLVLVSSRRSPQSNLTLSAWKIDGPSPAPQWRLSSSLPSAHHTPFLPGPHLVAEDITEYTPSAPVTLVFVVWSAVPTARPTAATLQLLTTNGESVAQRDVVLLPHWKGTAVNVTFQANLRCDLHILQTILTSAEGARGELSIALYCQQLLSETRAWQESLAAYRRSQRRKWGGMGLY